MKPKGVFIESLFGVGDGWQAGRLARLCLEIPKTAEERRGRVSGKKNTTGEKRGQLYKANSKVIRGKLNNNWHYN